MTRRYVRAPPSRLRDLPRTEVLGREVWVASTTISRLLGLAFIDLDRAGTGLLIPDCRSIHTFGMRFPLDVVFLDRRGMPRCRPTKVGPSRFLHDRHATSVLELPPQERGGGEIDPASD